jgi:hypothetical protein
MLDRKLEPLCHIVSVNMVHELGAKAGIQISQRPIGIQPGPLMWARLEHSGDEATGSASAAISA